MHILDGRIPHCLLLEIFTNRGIGTAILGDSEERFYSITCSNGKRTDSRFVCRVQDIEQRGYVNCNKNHLTQTIGCLQLIYMEIFVRIRDIAISDDFCKGECR